MGDIRWTDKIHLNNNGDIVDTFTGEVIGHFEIEMCSESEDNNLENGSNGR